MQTDQITKTGNQTKTCLGMKREKRVKLGKWNKKDPIRWPKMSDQVNWNALKNYVYLELPTYGAITKKDKNRFYVRKLLICLAL